MREVSVAYDGWQVLSPPQKGIIFVPQYDRNQLWVERVNEAGNHAEWIRRANWDGGESEATTFSEANLRMTRRNPHDARYFRDNAVLICQAHGWPRDCIIEIDNGAPNSHAEGDGADEASKRRQVIDALDAQSVTEPWSLVVFINHGWDTGIQMGFNIRSEPQAQRTREMLQLIAERSRTDLVLPIYGCDTAKGENGGEGHFADFVRDTLRDFGLANCRIDGHTVAGKAMECPHVRRFEGSGRGGEWIIDPGPEPLNPSDSFNAWKHALLERGADSLKLRYPLMSTAAIRAEVSRLL